MAAEVGQDLHLRASLFSRDVIDTVVATSRAKSCLVNKEEVYGKLNTLWWNALAKVGGVSTPMISIPKEISLSRDPRLISALPPMIGRLTVAEGRPPPFLLLPTHHKSMESILTKFTVKDPTARDEELSNMGVSASEVSYRKKRRRTPTSTSTTDVVMGSLVLVDGKPGRVVQIQRQERSRSLSVKIRFTTIPTQFCPRAGASDQDEVELEWPHPSITSPFADASSHSFVPAELDEDEEGHPAPVPSDAGSLEALFEDILGPDPLYSAPPASKEGVLSELEADLFGLEELVGAISAGSVPGGGSAVKRHEDVVLLTGERLSTQCLEEMEEYFKLMRQAKKRVVVHPPQRRTVQTAVSLSAEEDPLAPAPAVDITIVGKLRKITRSERDWGVEIEDVYIRSEAAGPSKMDIILPVVKIRMDVTELFGASAR